MSTKQTPLRSIKAIILAFGLQSPTSSAQLLSCSRQRQNPSDVVVLSLFGSYTVIGDVHRYEATLLSRAHS